MKITLKSSLISSRTSTIVNNFRSTTKVQTCSIESKMIRLPKMQDLNYLTITVSQQPTSPVTPRTTSRFRMTIRSLPLVLITSMCARRCPSVCVLPASTVALELIRARVSLLWRIRRRPLPTMRSLISLAIDSFSCEIDAYFHKNHTLMLLNLSEKAIDKWYQ